jgi:dCMP deaminase
MKANWDKRFINLARHIADWSKDRATRVGAVIVDDENTILSVGYNGFTRGMDDEIDSRHERPAKYLYTEHAERNSIYNAVRSGVCLKGAKIYLPWFPCTDCARAIINSGIKTIVATEPDYDMEKWGDLFKVSYEMLTECGVKIQWYSDEFDKWDEVPYFEDKWNYKGWTDFEPSTWSQSGWNQTLLLKINEVGTHIHQANQISPANKIRVPAHLFHLIGGLKYYETEIRKISRRYDVIVTDEKKGDKILVYYDGIKGRTDKSKDCGIIKIENYE